MHHIKEIDEKQNTVIAIQVENEIGMLPDARTYDEAANTAFHQPVPEQLLSYLQKNKHTCFRSSILFGRQMVIKLQVPGKKFLENLFPPMRFLWPGIMQFLQMKLPLQVKPSIIYQCMLMPH